MKTGGLILSLLLTLGVAACSVDTSEPSQSEQTRYQLEADKVSVFDGSGRLLGEIASKVEHNEGWARLTTGSSTLSAKFRVKFDQKDWIVEGTAEGKPFSVRVSDDGRVIGGAPLALSEDTKALINAVKTNPPEFSGTAAGYRTTDWFTRDNCQAAGYALVAGGTATADPILLVIGLAFLAGCN